MVGGVKLIVGSCTDFTVFRCFFCQDMRGSINEWLFTFAHFRMNVLVVTLTLCVTAARQTEQAAEYHHLLSDASFPVKAVYKITFLLTLTDEVSLYSL